MIVITGLRRSGTSMLMKALKDAGLKIVGDKWAIDADDDNKEANPNGYWELEHITSDEGLTERSKIVEEMGDVVKVMAECLPKSDPNMIDKVVMIMREPRNAMYSLFKHNSIEKHGIFILNCCLDLIDTIEYLETFKKDYKIVFYEDIIENPEVEMKKICEFVGGDYKLGAKAIDKELNRSKGRQYQFINHLENIYNLAKNNDVNKIIALKPEIESTAYEVLKRL